MASKATPPRQHPLNNFATHWELDGDLIRCRCCNRAQQTSWMRHDFPHASGCRNVKAERTPWLTLGSLITAQISRAREPEAINDGQ